MSRIGGMRIAPMARRPFRYDRCGARGVAGRIVVTDRRLRPPAKFADLIVLPHFRGTCAT